MTNLVLVSNTNAISVTVLSWTDQCYFFTNGLGYGLALGLSLVIVMAVTKAVRSGFSFKQD